MSFELLQTPHKRTGRDSRMATVAAYNRGKTAVQMEFNFKDEIAQFLGVGVGDRVSVGIGTGDDAGRYVLVKSSIGNRVHRRNSFLSVRISATYSHARVIPFSVRKLVVESLDKDERAVTLREVSV